MTRFDDFVNKYSNVIPGATDSLKLAIKPCLTLFDFPKEEWKVLRTTNAIERVNKEFKRRTKPMEKLAGGVLLQMEKEFPQIKLRGKETSDGRERESEQKTLQC